jgi:hypothetical protein
VASCLLDLFRLVVLLAHALRLDEVPLPRAARYPDAEPTFVDALAAVRRHLWARGIGQLTSARLPWPIPQLLCSTHSWKRPPTPPDRANDGNGRSMVRNQCGN